jgi:TolB protein
MRRQAALGAMLVFVVVAVAWLAVATPAGAAFPGRNGLIAFWGGFNDPNNGPIQVRVMNPDGSGVTSLSHDPGVVDGLPRWSPDGTQIVFARLILGEPFFNLYRMAADGSGVTRLTNQMQAPDYFATWTAGGQIVFARGQGECGPGVSLWVINADGTGLRQLTDPSYAACLPAAAPHGSKIAFTGSFDGGATFQIYTIDLDGSGLRRLSPPGVLFEYRPNWSPEGNDIVFLSAPVPGQLYRSLWTMHSNGGQRVQILPGTPSWDAPAWSPDGRFIVLHTCTDDQQVLGACHIWVVTRDGSSRTQLTFAPPGQFDANADWQPIGK